MDIQTRKFKVIQQIVMLENEVLLTKLEHILHKVTAGSSFPAPLVQEQTVAYKHSILKAKDRVEGGKGIIFSNKQFEQLSQQLLKGEKSIIETALK